MAGDGRSTRGAELRRRVAMAAGGVGADSARGWLERARDGAKEVEGEVARLGAQGIEARRRVVAGIGTGGNSARAQLDQRMRKEKERGKTDTAPGEGIRTGAQARQARFADGRRVASPALLPVDGMGARTASLESTVD